MAEKAKKKAMDAIIREANRTLKKLSLLTTLYFDNEAEQSIKWTDEEIAMLHSCVHRFALGINKLNRNIKNRSISEHRKRLREKAIHDRMLRHRENNLIDDDSPKSLQISILANDIKITRKMVKAAQKEVDVHSLTNNVKFEYNAQNLGEVVSRLI